MTPILGFARRAVRAHDARRSARLQLAAIEAEAGRATRQLELDGARAGPGAFAKADAYAREVLGSPVYAPWLKMYATAAGVFREGWIPNNYYGAEVITRIDGRYRRAADAKTFINRVMRSPNVPDVAYVIRGLFYDRDYRLVTDEQFVETLFATSGKAVFKAENSGRGRSFEVITPETLDIEKFRRARNGVFQHYVQQDAFFDQMMTGSATTLRLNTVIDPKGAASLRAALLRAARSEDSCVKYDKAVNASVDISTGRLATVAYMPDWTKVDRHPDSGFVYAGQEIPGFREAVDVALALHRSFPMLSSIGWDICIDADGVPQILEWNTSHNGIIFAEAFSGPCYADMGWETLWKEPIPKR